MDGQCGRAGDYVDKRRIEADLTALAAIGAQEGGGITRRAYSREDEAARAYIMAAMSQAGLAVRVDAAGNIFARRAESGATGSPVMSGSHLDTVPRGGSLDGALGVVAALEAIRAIDDAGLNLSYPLEVVVFVDEEGARFNNIGLMGSRAVRGTLTAEEVQSCCDHNGVTIAEAWRRWGLDPTRLSDARRDPSTIRAYVELHIEQGAVLDTAGLPVGVVTGIATPVNLTFRLVGAADHAGATPMTLRRDALTGAAELILAVERIARDELGPPTVATVGMLDIVPGASNVVPGEVTLAVDVRHVEATELNRGIARIRQEAAAIAARRSLSVTAEEVGRIEPVDLSPMVIEAIGAACRAADTPHMYLSSGAAHDAMNVAHLAPTGMIFVPSVGGRSHCPEEATRADDIVAGVRVLAHTLARLAT